MIKVLVFLIFLLNFQLVFSDELGFEKTFEEFEIRQEKYREYLSGLDQNFKSTSSKDDFKMRVSIKLSEDDFKNNITEKILQEKGINEYKKPKHIPYLFLSLTYEQILNIEDEVNIEKISPQSFFKASLADSNKLIGNEYVVNKYESSGKDQTIVILDTPFDTNHIFYKDNIIDGACFSSAINSDERSLCQNGEEIDYGIESANLEQCLNYYLGSYYFCSHGTHVAGIAAGQNKTLDNGKYIYGAAKDANLILINVFTFTYDGYAIGSYDQDRILAFEHIYDLMSQNPNLNISVISASLGSSQSYSFYCNDLGGENDIIKKLKDDFGIITVYASGNEGLDSSISSPACYEDTISVGSVDKNLEISDFSNVANILDFFAIGGEVLSSYPSSSNDATETFSGTSMATPFFSGSYATIKSAFPDWSYVEVLDAIEQTGTIIKSDNGIETPLINLTKLFDEFYPDIEYTTNLSDYTNLNKTLLKFYINFSRKIDSYDINFNGDYSIDSSDNYLFNITLTSFSNGENIFEINLSDLLGEVVNIEKTIYFDNTPPKIHYFKFIDSNQSEFYNNSNLEYLQNYSLEISIEDFSQIKYNSNDCLDLKEYNQNGLSKNHEICNITQEDDNNYILSKNNFYFDNSNENSLIFELEIFDNLDNQISQNYSFDLKDTIPPKIHYFKFIDSNQSEFYNNSNLEYLQNYSLEISIEDFSQIKYNSNDCLDLKEYSKNILTNNYEICNIVQDEHNYILVRDNFYFNNSNQTSLVFELELFDNLDNQISQNYSFDLKDTISPEIKSIYINNVLIENNTLNLDYFETSFNISLEFYDFSNISVDFSTDFYDDEIFFTMKDIGDYTKLYNISYVDPKIDSNFNLTFDIKDNSQNFITYDIKVTYPDKLFDDISIFEISNNTVEYVEDLPQSIWILSNKNISKYVLSYDSLSFTNNSVNTDFFEIDFILDAYGNKDIFIELYDEYDYAYKMYYYNKTFLSYLGVDLDGDGLDDLEDNLIADTNLDIGVENITLKIDESTNLSKNFTQNSLVEIKKDNSSFIEFYNDFSSKKLDFNNVEISYTKGETSKIKINGLEGNSKKVYFEVENNSKVLCIKNLEIFDYSQISEDCSKSDEIKVDGLPFEERNIKVSLNNLIFEIEGLENTAVIQLDEKIEEEETQEEDEDDEENRRSSSSSGGGGGSSSSKDEDDEEVLKQYLNLTSLNKAQYFKIYDLSFDSNNYTLSFLSNEDESTFRVLINGKTNLVEIQKRFGFDLDGDDIFDIEIFIEGENRGEVSFVLSRYNSKKLPLQTENKEEILEEIIIEQEEKTQKIVEESKEEDKLNTDLLLYFGIGIGSLIAIILLIYLLTLYFNNRNQIEK